jgi:hypothetical protein
MAPKKNDSKSPVAQEVTPVVPVQEVAPAPVKKGGAKKETAPVVAKVEVAPVVAKVEVAPVVAKVEVAPVKKGGAKKATAPVVAPVVAAVAPVAAPVVAAAPETAVKKGGAKKAAPAKAVEVAPVQEAGAKAPKAKVAKVAKAPKVAKVAKVAKEVKEGEEGEAEVDEDDKTRSFKVLLPNQEEYSGRFTGLTPYQAANKALSKYFRTLKNEDVSENINFSIRESTRGSKRNTYSYKGGRIKLAVPIKYNIKSADGEAREIVKEYKNQLVKVKKAEMKAEAPVAVV